MSKAGRTETEGAGESLNGFEARFAVEKPLRPAQCRAYMRRTLAREFPGIVQGFVEGARKGSCQHIKLATELLAEPARRPARSGRGTVSRLIEELERAEA